MLYKGAEMFEEAVNSILEYEGGYINDPNDPGGETKYGISKRAYPSLNIAALKVEEAKGIYKRDYWDKCRCDELPDGVNFAVFDCAVNQGVKTAILLLQEALKVTADGIIGPATLNAVKKSEPIQLLIDFIALRGIRYTQSSRFNVYALGWFRRLISTTLDAYRATLA
jgi:lysozyme family protein